MSQSNLDRHDEIFSIVIKTLQCVLYVVVIAYLIANGLAKYCGGHL
jgi:hypothetical protein